MRIISGLFRSRQLAAPRGNNTRPSTDHIRESIYNLLAPRLDLEGTVVLDLFAGSGALGFEALSRGAEHVTFVDHDTEAVRTIRRNSVTLGVEDACTILGVDVPTYLKKRDRGDFDLILADPPYQYAQMNLIVSTALEKLAEDGLFVLEHESSVRFDEAEDRIVRSRRYGRTSVTLFT